MDLTKCTACGKKLGKSVFYLNRQRSTGRYVRPNKALDEGWYGTPDDDGQFPFGIDCARAEAKK